MKTRSILALTAFAATLAAFAVPSDAQSGGALGTMPHGKYQCALPGDAGGAAFDPVPAEDFSFSGASSYNVAAGSGTYILRGNELTFTRGPKKGEKFRRIGENQLRIIAADGRLGRLVCTRLGSNR